MLKRLGVLYKNSLPKIWGKSTNTRSEKKNEYNEIRPVQSTTQHITKCLWVMQ
jgi:hypothetical protein